MLYSRLAWYIVHTHWQQFVKWQITHFSWKKNSNNKKQNPFHLKNKKECRVQRFIHFQTMVILFQIIWKKYLEKVLNFPFHFISSYFVFCLKNSHSTVITITLNQLIGIARNTGKNHVEPPDTLNFKSQSSTIIDLALSKRHLVDFLSSSFTIWCQLVNDYI